MQVVILMLWLDYLTRLICFAFCPCICFMFSIGHRLAHKFFTVNLTLWSRFFKELVFNLVSFVYKDLKTCMSVMK